MRKSSKKPRSNGKARPAASRSKREALSPVSCTGSLSPFWLDELPAELSERIARFVSRGRSCEALLHLAKTSAPQHAAAVAAHDYKPALHSLSDRKSGAKWAQVFGGHVREVTYLKSDWQVSFQHLRSLVLGSQLRRFTFELSDDERLPVLLPQRSWDDVEVDLIITDEDPFERALQTIRLVKPRRVTFSGWSPENDYDLLNREEGKILIQDLFEELTCVSEVQVHWCEGLTHWLCLLLSLLPGRTSLDITTDFPLDALQKLREVDEISISQCERAVGNVWDFIELGQAVVELKIEPVLREYVVSAQYLARLAEWFPNLRRLDISLEVGSETHLAGTMSKLTKLKDLALSWEGKSEGEEGERYHRPTPGMILEGVKRCNRLSNVRLEKVELDAEEIADMLRHLGGNVQWFSTDLSHGPELRGPELLKGALTVVGAAAQHCPALRWLYTNVQETRAWRERSEAWKRKFAAAGRVLEKRCVHLFEYCFESLCY